MPLPMRLHTLYSYVVDGARSVPAAGLQKRDERIKREFEFVLSDARLSRVFRAVLRTLHFKRAVAPIDELETILYGNNSDQLPTLALLGASYEFPVTSSIKATFAALNTRYCFFSADDEEAYENFSKFFIVAKLIADYVERNNTFDNEVAYLHAYKMLVLFGAEKGPVFSKYVDAYLSDHNFNTLDTPIHDALVIEIPRQSNTAPIHLDAWRALIKTSGIKVVQLFRRAPAIEQALKGRAPSDLVEAMYVKNMLCYARYDENPALATLCGLYELSENNFNRCLAIELTRKTSDLMPEVIVDGAECVPAHPGYFLVKLPCDDPRAYVLGHITNCCQSIGGHSEQCVIDGVTNAHNGFYVLLKRLPRSNPAAKPITTHKNSTKPKINDQDFTIVGQGYAWLSRRGNITFDSWENLRPSDNAVIIPMLYRFGDIVTHSEIYHDMLRVTIGTGGNTPEDFLKIAEPCLDPEKMQEGEQYDDSAAQAIVYINKEKLARLQDPLMKGLGDIAKAWPWASYDVNSKLTQIIAGFSSVKSFQAMQELFLSATHPDWDSLLVAPIGVHLKAQLAQMSGAQISELIEGVLQLHQAKILTPANFSFFAAGVPYAQLNSILRRLQQAGILITTSGFLLLITARVRDLDNIDQALGILQQAKILTADNSMLITTRPESANSIALVLAQLHKAGILTPENRKFISSRMVYAYSINMSLKMLQEAGIVVTSEDFISLTTNADSAYNIALAWVNLHKYGLSTPANIKLLAALASFAVNISMQRFDKHDDFKGFIATLPLDAARPRDGATPASIAAANGYDSVIAELARYGLDLKQARQADGTPIALLAAEKGHVHVIAELAKHGVDFNQGRYIDEATAAIFAAQHGHVDVIAELAKHGADFNLATKDKGITPAFQAAQNGHVAVIAELAKHHTDFDKAHVNGATPAYIAAQNGHAFVITELAKHHAKLSQARADGTTPAFIAADRGHASVIVELAKHGADLNQARDDATPAFIAAQNGHIEVIKQLIQYGADINSHFISSVENLKKFASTCGKDVIDRMQEFIDQKLAAGSQESAIAMRPSDIAFIMHHEEIAKLLHEYESSLTVEQQEVSQLIGAVPEPNCYEILGLSKKADADAIKKAYRKLALLHHPDRSPGNRAEAERKFKLISEAYGILSNLETKAAYDSSRSDDRSTASSSTFFKRIP